MNFKVFVIDLTPKCNYDLRSKTSNMRVTKKANDGNEMLL